MSRKRERSSFAQPSRLAVTMTLVLAIGLLSVPRTSAQGMHGSVPDPISTSDLLRSGDLLQLSPAQLQAIFIMHDEYKAAFRALRLGEMTQFRNRMIAWFGDDRPPKPSVLKAFREDVRALNQRIDEMDKRLLDQIASVLAPEQAERLPRIRMARQRDCITMTSNNLRPVLNVSDLTQRLQLPFPERQAIEPLLAEYERELTRFVVELRKIDISTGLERDESLKAYGVVEADFDSPQSQEKISQAENDLFLAAERKIVRLLNEAADLNMRTYRALAAILPAESARRVRDAFYREAYSLTFGDEDMTLREALRLELDAPQRDALRAAQAEFRAVVDPLLEETVAYYDRFRRETMLGANLSGDEHLRQRKVQEYQQTTERLGASAQTAQAKASEALIATLGPELTEQVRALALKKTRFAPPSAGRSSGRHFLTCATHRSILPKRTCSTVSL